jgi:hypothetical protein
MGNVSDRVVEKTETHFIFKNFFLEYLAFHEIMRKNIVEGAGHK